MVDLANSSTKPKPKLKLYPRNPNRRSQTERDLVRERLENQKDERIRLLCEGGQHTIPTPHDRRRCPNLPCNYCKQEGHMAPPCQLANNKRPEYPQRKRSLEDAHADERQKKSFGDRESEQTLGIVHEVSLKNPRWIAKTRGFAPSFECPGMLLLGQEISAPEEAWRKASSLRSARFCRLRPQRPMYSPSFIISAPWQLRRQRPLALGRRGSEQKNERRKRNELSQNHQLRKNRKKTTSNTSTDWTRLWT